MIGAATDVVATLLEFSQPADAVLSNYFRNNRQLGQLAWGRHVPIRSGMVVLQGQRNFEAFKDFVTKVKVTHFFLAFLMARTALATVVYVNSTGRVKQVQTQNLPRHGSPWPARYGLGVHAPLHQLNHLAALIQQQLALVHVGRARWVVVDQDVGRAVQVSMLGVEGHLVRGQGNLLAALDYLELDHHENPGVAECHQAVRCPEIHAGFNPGYMAAW